VIARIRFTMVLLVVAGLAGVLDAQNLGSIVGLVSDTTGAVIPGAEVKITDQDTGFVRTFLTNETGNYVAPALPLGKYTVEVSAKGFKSWRQNDVLLNLRDIIRVDVQLEVGEMAETVEVHEETVRLKTENATVDEVVNGTQVEALSMNARNFTSLAALVPGASSSQPPFNIPVGVSTNTGINFDGTRQSHNVWRVDGQENYDRGCGGCITVLPSIDAIAEMKVGTANTEADTGFGAAGQINLTIKSGTKNLHGTLFEFVRNDDFDAANYFANLSGSGKPHLRFNNFGYNLGGPMPLPHMKWRTEPKVFFFWSEEWRRLRQGQQFYAQAAPASWRTGNFSDLTTPIIDPLTKAPFPGNVIPASRLDPNALILANPNLILPLPTTSNDFYAQSVSTPTNVREEILRVDYNISEKHQVFFRFIDDSTVQNFATTMWSGSSYPTAGTTFINPPKMYHGQWTASITPNMVNEFSYSYQKQPLNLDPTGIWQRPSGLDIPKLFDNNGNNKIPDLNFSTGFAASYQISINPWFNVSNTHFVRDNLSLHHGSHTMTIGGIYMYFQKQQQLFGNTNGSFNFNGAYTGNGFADFMLGDAYSYYEQSAQTAPNYITQSVGFFVNDTWNVTPKLTINAGLRWDALPHAVEQHNQVSVFYPWLYQASQAPQVTSNGQLVPDTGNPLNGIAEAGKNGIPRGLVQNHWDLFEPRLGLAWRPFGENTVFRAGYGIYYDRIQGNDIYNVATNPPFITVPNIYNTTLSNPGGGSRALFPVGITTYDGVYKLPQVMNWNVGIQRKLSQGVVLTTSYVGTKSTHLQGGLNINEPTIAQAAPVRAGTANISQVVPYLGYAGINEYFNGTNSTYNSLQVSVRTDNFHGLTLETSYTWSHALDYNDGDVPGNIAQNPYNWKLEHASAGFDRRQMLIMSYVYQLPFFAGRHGFAKAALGGWQISGISTFESGAPMDTSFGGDPAGVGGTNYRPNVSGNPNTGSRTQAEWFNTAVFSGLAPGTFGDAGRNILIGPGTNNWDISLFKNFEGIIGGRESTRLQFRAESYNAFNHTQFTGVNTTFNSGAFGVVTSARDARSLQLALKLYF
jgi:hypothetical protein